MKSKRNYLIIILYGIILTFLLLGINNLYGSSTDWINQHSVIPEYFRNTFYETGNLLPNFAFNLGAGQNIFNYAYYGFLSPIILISYLLPFINMTTYVITASILLYLLSGLLIYRFLTSNKYSDKTSLILSLCFLSLSPLTYHFHHHIMFVWYIPFLILALMGVDQYVNKNKSFLLMISVFLIIMTNYYYSVTSIVVVLIYGLYKLINKNDKFTWKIFLQDILKSAIRIIIPILLAGIILMPSLYVTLSSGRTSINSTTLTNLILPNVSEVLYRSYTMGLTSLFLIAPLGLIFSKKKNKGEVILSIIVLIFTLIPFFMYALNGFLYVRGKVLIPFVVLYIFILAKFIEHLKNDNVNLKYILGSFTIILLLFLLGKNADKFFKLFYIVIILESSITYISIWYFSKKKNEKILLLPLLLVLIISSFVNNFSEHYVSINEYKEINNKDITNLIDNISDNNFYRTNTNILPYLTANKSYKYNYYSTNIYSSNYNNYYWDFYNFKTGNNIKYRNAFITAGADNVLFDDFMGIKYIIDTKDKGPNYEKIKTSGKLGLYKNKSALPIIYITEKVGSYEEYNKLEFPFNMEYMINNPVVKEKGTTNYKTKINETKLVKKDSYDFNLKKNTKYNYKLKNPIQNKILIITFDMDYNGSCKEKDSIITINGITNKLTCKDWMYHNQNKRFEYVISNSNNITNLNIEIGKGKYKISNIKTYIMDYPINTYNSLKNIKINRSKSIITASINTNSSKNVITSIPYDDGFSVYVDNKQIDKEIVNTSFLGFKIEKGNHNIKIKYNSPWLKLGYLLTFIGLLLMLVVLLYERFKRKIKNI